MKWTCADRMTCNEGQSMERKSNGLAGQTGSMQLGSISNKVEW